MCLYGYFVLLLVFFFLLSFFFLHLHHTYLHHIVLFVRGFSLLLLFILHLLVTFFLIVSLSFSPFPVTLHVFLSLTFFLSSPFLYKLLCSCYLFSHILTFFSSHYFQFTFFFCTSFTFPYFLIHLHIFHLYYGSSSLLFHFFPFPSSNLSPFLIFYIFPIYTCCLISHTAFLHFLSSPLRSSFRLLYSYSLDFH